jgi:hypothetical protein
MEMTASLMASFTDRTKRYVGRSRRARSKETRACLYAESRKEAAMAAIESGKATHQAVSTVLLAALCTTPPFCTSMRRTARLLLPQLAVQRIWVDLPRLAAHRGHEAPSLIRWIARGESRRRGRTALGAAGRQLNPDARDVLDHARADLEQTSADG